MGCVCSHSERAIPINAPSKKQISTPLENSSTLKSPAKTNSELHRLDADKNQSSMGIFAESFVIPSTTSRGRRNLENKESIKSNIPKVIVKDETIKDSSIKPNFDSVSSIDPKEIPYLSQIIRARSNDSSVKEILPAFETRSSFTRASKPSIFLSPSFFSEKTMNKIGTTGEGFHLNIPKSNDDFSMASLRFDSHRGDRGGLLFGDKEKGKENTGTNILSPRKFLLVVPEQTDSYVETRVMNRIDSNDNNILEGIEENSSTRDKFGDTTRDQDREKAEKGNGGGFGRLDSMDPNVRPWVSGNVPKNRKSSSISGKGYKISVNDSSFDKPHPPKKNLKLPQIKLNEDNFFLDPNFNRKGLNTSMGSPKAGLQGNTIEDEGFQLTLIIPSTAASNTNHTNNQNKAKNEDANSDSTPQSNKTGSNTARKDFPKVEVTHVEHGDNEPLISNKGELMQNFIKTKVTVNLLDAILKKPPAKIKEKESEENGQNKQGPNPSEKAALETTVTLKKKVSETSSVKMGHLNDTILSSKEKFKPLDLQKLDLFNVSAANDFSPISRQLQYTGNSTPGNSKMDSSFLKPMTIATYDNPTSVEDRISYQEEGISYLDLEKYNYVGSQEIDASPMNLHPHRPPKISAFGAKKIVYNKSKSVNFDEQMPLEKPTQFLDLPKTHIQETNDNTGKTQKQALLSPFYESRNSYETANSMKDVSFIAQLPAEEKRKIFTRHRPKSQVIETDSVNKSVDEGGQKKINQYALGRELGRGTFGKVKMAVDTNTQAQYAIKIINKAKLQRKVFAKNKTAYTQIQAEIAIMTKMEHPNIVRLYEVIDAPDEDKLYLVMELVEKGAVMTHEFFSKNKGNYVEKEIETPAGKMTIKCLTENAARKYFRDLVLGIDYMHNYANVIHRDIKPENLLIGQDDRLKLSDFNIAHMVDESNDVIKTKGGTRHFLAPEAWISDSFRGRPLDIWAAGATLYYFLYGTPPFPTTNPSELKRKIVEDEPLFPEEAGVSEEAISLIKACLTKNVEHRITLDEIFEDSWLTENGKVDFNNDMYKVVEINAEDIRKALNVKFQTAMLVATGLVRSLHTARKTLTSMQLDSLIMDKNDENDK